MKVGNVKVSVTLRLRLKGRVQKFSQPESSRFFVTVPYMDLGFHISTKRQVQDTRAHFSICPERSNRKLYSRSYLYDFFKVHYSPTN